MELNNDLITQFAKITKFNTGKSATTVRGTIRKADENARPYLVIDGAEEDSKTPVDTVVEVADGDRVIATVKDHSVIVTGNKTNPAIGTKTAGALSSKIEQTAEAIRTEVSDAVKGVNSSITQTADEIRSEVSDAVKGVNSSITQTADEIRSEVIKEVDGKYSTVKQTVDGLTVETVNGKTIIDGGNIKAGSLELTGAITWGDLDDTAKDNIDGAASDAAGSAISGLEEEIEDIGQLASDAKYNADAALELFVNMEIPELPIYIKNTHIDKARIESPTIIGGHIYAVGSDPKLNSTFTTMDENGFYLYSNATIADTNNTIYPKISMMCSDTMNERPMFILGAGESDEYIYHNRFIIEKSSSNVWLDYHFDYSYPGCGIEFSRDGEITITGDVTITGTLTADYDVFPIGYIYLSYNHTSPASLFGGTWTRLSPYFLYAAGSGATIGETGYVNVSGTAAQYIKISAWRRTG